MSLGVGDVSVPAAAAGPVRNGTVVLVGPKRLGRTQIPERWRLRVGAGVVSGIRKPQYNRILPAEDRLGGTEHWV